MNTGHQLKSKLTCPKSMKLKNGTGAITTAKNVVVIGL